MLTGSRAAASGCKVRKALSAACPNTHPNAVPMSNGLVDARRLIGYQSIASTVTMPPNCTLLIGSGVLKEAVGARLLYDSGDRIIGTGYSGSGTQITDTVGDTTPMIAYVNGMAGAGATGADISDLQIYGTGTVGSLGLDMRHTLGADVHDLSISKVDTGLIMGFPGACDCYNSFFDVFIYGTTYGAKFLHGANQNQWYGGRFGGSTGLYLGGGANQFFSPDFELDGIGVHFVAEGTGNSLFTPYFEANRTNVLIDPMVYSNVVIGGAWSSGISDNSGNTSNWMFGTGSSAAPGGYPPKAIGAGQFNVGGNLDDSGAAHLIDSSGVDGGVEFDWSKHRTSTYGREGGANFHAGALYSVGGANLNTTTIGPLPNPIAPTITQHGTAGTTTYSYYLVCHTPTGDVTMPSPAGITSSGNRTLSYSNYNNVRYSCGAGFNGADILKNGTSGIVLLAGRTFTGPNGFINDTGQVLSTYARRPATRQAT